MVGWSRWGVCLVVRNISTLLVTLEGAVVQLRPAVPNETLTPLLSFLYKYGLSSSSSSSSSYIHIYHLKPTYTSHHGFGPIIRASLLCPMQLLHHCSCRKYLICISIRTHTNTITKFIVLQVGIPRKRLLETVTVKCGHCSNLSFLSTKPPFQGQTSYDHQIPGLHQVTTLIN